MLDVITSKTAFKCSLNSLVQKANLVLSSLRVIRTQKKIIFHFKAIVQETFFFLPFFMSQRDLKILYCNNNSHCQRWYFKLYYCTTSYNNGIRVVVFIKRNNTKQLKEINANTFCQNSIDSVRVQNLTYKMIKKKYDPSG